MIRRLVLATFAVVVASLACVLGLAALARAQTTETIHRYHVAIRIERDGSLTITEAIDYDFGPTPHHGIFRDIPTTLRYDGTSDRVYSLEVVSVTATGGAPAGYTVEGVDGGKT
jgi:Predicted membrane protein (DUF2207)